MAALVTAIKMSRLVYLKNKNCFKISDFSTFNITLNFFFPDSSHNNPNPWNPSGKHNLRCCRSWDCECRASVKYCCLSISSARMHEFWGASAFPDTCPITWREFYNILWFEKRQHSYSTCFAIFFNASAADDCVWRIHFWSWKQHLSTNFKSDDTYISVHKSWSGNLHSSFQHRNVSDRPPLTNHIFCVTNRSAYSSS